MYRQDQSRTRPAAAPECRSRQTTRTPVCKSHLVSHLCFFPPMRPILCTGNSGSRKHVTFFIMPALRLEKVMCRRDLSWMNLMSIFRRSRPGLSSSSSSSSAAALTRGRLTPRESAVLPLPVASSRLGEWVFGSVMSAMLAMAGRTGSRGIDGRAVTRSQLGPAAGATQCAE